MFVKRFLFSSSCVIRDFTKGHFIDDSNEYKFIYVPASSSSEKKHFFDYRWVFNFFGQAWINALICALICHVTEVCIRYPVPMWPLTVVIDTFFAFWSFLVVQQNFNFRFQCPCYKPGAHAQYTIRWSMLRLGLRASLGPAIKTNRTPQIEKTYLLVIQHTSDEWSSTFCLFLLDKQPNRTLSATLVETFLCASFHTFSCYLPFFSFWNEHHC